LLKKGFHGVDEFLLIELFFRLAFSRLNGLRLLD
jgi:hypothetical protein